MSTRNVSWRRAASERARGVAGGRAWEDSSSCAGHLFNKSRIVTVGSENISKKRGGFGSNFRIGLKDLTNGPVLCSLNQDALKSIMFRHIVHFRISSFEGVKRFKNFLYLGVADFGELRPLNDTRKVALGRI
jgi:hypothetical protein